MSTYNQLLETKILSSLTKVFADEDLTDNPFRKGSSLLNEMYSYQIAYRHTGNVMKNIQVDVESDLVDYISVRSVGLVPSELPSYNDPDEDIIRSTPGLYPDPLFPIDEEGIIGFPNQWRSIWITVDVEKNANPGVHQIKVIFKTNHGEKLASETFELEIIPVELPVQKLIHTQWFHTDCLAIQYNVDIFSESHWNLIDQYVKTAVSHGINMILTPLFTPPLDTEIGGERPTVQLVEVEKIGSQYHFTFEKLKRWIEQCKESGIQFFEFAHFFTQWGAHHAPKIIGLENGQKKQLFGWETDASGADYKNFLSQFLPKLVLFIKQYHLEKNVYFHVSDEPGLHQLESYKNASDIIHTYLSEFPIMDALSDYNFYEEGLIKNPIPSNNHIEQFLDNKVPNLWTYYCCAQYKEVSNRFFNFPSARNRIIGLQFYKYDIKGFLHWGYNFWFSQFSRKPIDPFKNTDANYSFPSGDAFLVYPGEHGPIESIRLEVFYEALQDMRALQLLENIIGRKEVIEFLDDKLDEPITFNQYPLDKDWLLAKRAEINQKIKELSINTR